MTILILHVRNFEGLGHPAELDIACFDFVCQNSKKYTLEPMSFIASLFKTKDQVSRFSEATIP